MQKEQIELDKKNVKQEQASKQYLEQISTQTKKIEELKQSLDDNRKKQEELKALAESESALKLKAEEEKKAMDERKTQMVQDTLRFAIMRGRQNKIIA